MGHHNAADRPGLNGYYHGAVNEMKVALEKHPETLPKVPELKPRGPEEPLAAYAERRVNTAIAEARKEPDEAKRKAIFVAAGLPKSAEDLARRLAPRKSAV